MKLKNSIRCVIITCLIVVLSVNFSCKSKYALSAAEAAAELVALESILNEKDYRIAIKTVYPFNTAATTAVINQLITPRTGNTASMINVTGDGHFIEIRDITHAKGHLPFFGEQRFSGSQYNSGRGIAFDGELKDYSVTRDHKRNALRVNYSIADTNDAVQNYDIQLLIFANKSVAIIIQSTIKAIIRYRGTLKVVETTKP